MNQHIKIIALVILVLIAICVLLLLLECLRGRIALSRIKNDEEMDDWYPWQFLGLTILIKDRAICYIIIFIALLLVISISYWLGTEAIY